jgi:hypothetical protein
MIAVAVAGLATAGALEAVRFYDWKRQWNRLDWKERVCRETSNSFAARVKRCERQAQAGVPFMPRSGFMPYGPIPIGEHAPQTWDEEAKYCSRQAALWSMAADKFAKQKPDFAWFRR